MSAILVSKYDAKTADLRKRLSAFIPEIALECHLEILCSKVRDTAANQKRPTASFIDRMAIAKLQMLWDSLQLNVFIQLP
jgi:hypothetical protein